MDEGLGRPDIAMGICSAATKAGFEQVVNSIVQEDRLGRFDVVKAGDDVDKKKPDPMIYNMAQELVNLPPEKCVVIEDSLVGLRAAKAAGMKCIITPTASTANADFHAEGADAVVEDLAGVTIDALFNTIYENGKVEDIKGKAAQPSNASTDAEPSMDDGGSTPQPAQSSPELQEIRKLLEMQTAAMVARQPAQPSEELQEIRKLLEMQTAAMAAPKAVQPSPELEALRKLLETQTMSQKETQDPQ